MRIDVVTTCNAQMWEDFGARATKSFVKCWPSGVRLKFYNEDLPEDKFPIGCLVSPFPKWFLDWKAKYKNVPDANGRDRSKNRTNRQDYDFKRDCVRFAHKIGALVDVMESTPADLVIWMDADIVTRYEVTEEWLLSLFPDRSYIAWLDRAKTYPECGFFMLRTGHQAHSQFTHYLRYIYEHGDVFKLPQTHDSFVIEYLIRNGIRDGWIEPPVSLSGPVGYKSSDPFSYSALAAKMTHLKGKKKYEGGARAAE